MLVMVLNLNKMKTENIKNLFKWEGFNKEIGWILFWIFLLVTAYGYYDLAKRHNDLLEKDCVWNCFVDEIVEINRIENPHLVVKCFNETRTCEFYGVLEGGIGLNDGG